jgi:Gluconate 2-dehydrogenase subunit 3
VSAPYPDNVRDRPVILDGLAWVAATSRQRFGTAFADASAAQRLALCEEMAPEAAPGSDRATAAKFFRQFRNLTASGYFSTPPGMKDLGYVGNVPSATFEGPPADLVARLGLTDEVKW